MQLILARIKLGRFPHLSLASFGRQALLHISDHLLPHHRNHYLPFLFTRRLTGLMSMLLVSVKIFSLSLLSFAPAGLAVSSAITPPNVIALTNASRHAFNLPALIEESRLTKAAQAKADHMAKAGYFAHNSPDGKTPWDFILGQGYEYLAAGENLAINFSQVESLEDAWMNSASHRANILNQTYEEIGIGIAQGSFQGKAATFVVQMLGTQAAQQINLTDKTTEVLKGSVPQPESLKSKVKAALFDANNISMFWQGEALKVQVLGSESLVKLIASADRTGFMFEPKDGGLWEAEIPLKSLVQSKSPLRLESYDLKGAHQAKTMLEMSGSTAENYDLTIASAKSAEQWEIGGLKVSNRFLQNTVYELFILAMVVALLVAVAAKRHIQHISLISNASFVIILACFMWVGWT
jgi:preprotein translocase subunit SecF